MQITDKKMSALVKTDEGEYMMIAKQKMHSFQSDSDDRKNFYALIDFLPGTRYQLNAIRVRNPVPTPSVPAEPI